MIVVVLEDLDLHLSSELVEQHLPIPSIKPHKGKLRQKEELMKRDLSQQLISILLISKIKIYHHQQ